MNVNLKDVKNAVDEMIIIDECRFRQVDKPVFRRLMSVACPRFQMASRTIVARDCYVMYKNERDRFKDFLKHCQRVSVTIDT